MEYFCAYHSMLGATRKLSDAECGRLFRALLVYSSGEQPVNLQGREELLFDVFSQQIDRDRERYDKKCATNKENASGRNRPKATAIDGIQEKDKEKDKEKEEQDPSPLSGGMPGGAGGAAYLETHLRSMTPGNWEELRSYLDDGLGMDLLHHAVDEACAQGKCTWAYVRRILDRYVTENIQTVEQAKATDGKPHPSCASSGLSPWLERDES